MELTFKLKQHTPIIHFQPDQKGATLRATEVKPKLDKYIKQIYSLDLKKTLRYQLKILSTGKTRVYDPSKDGLYFGDIGTDKKTIKKEGLLHNKITLRINTYFDQDLYDKIQVALPVCFAMENFGTRQNKGYGCFFDKNLSINEFEKILKENASSRVFFWDMNENNTFFSIKTVYSLLKSGINLPSQKPPLLDTTSFDDLKKKDGDFKKLTEDQPGIFKTKNGYTKITMREITDWRVKRKIKELLGPYTPKCNIYSKSLLFKYFKNNSKTESIIWDKKAIKMKFLPASGSGSSKSGKEAFVRAFLGISEEQDWVSNRFKLFIKSKEFSRVPSSVVFKVFKKQDGKSRIYFYSTKLYEKLLKKDFTFTTNKSSKSLILKTPDEFDMEDYLRWAVKEINTNLVVDEKENSYAAFIAGKMFDPAKRTLDFLNNIKGNIEEL